MAITHIPDGEDFGSSHFSREFGFKGSAEGAPATGQRRADRRQAREAPVRREHEREAAQEPGQYTEEAPAMAHGGHVHPHGHHVVHVEAREDGSVVHHHAHGGHTIHHADGHVSHHHGDGRPIGGAEHEGAHGGAEHHPHGHEVIGVEHRHDGSEVHRHAHGGHTVHHADGRVTHHAHDGSPVRHPEARHEHHGGAVRTHPHGHHVVHEEHGGDGSVIHHHSHGGMTIHHADGHVSHHSADGAAVHHGEPGYAHGGRAMDAHMAAGGFHSEHPDDAAEDRAMVERGVGEHESHLHHGEPHTALHLARGGRPGDVRPRLPRGLRPADERRRPALGTAERAPPVQEEPQSPEMTRTARGKRSDQANDYGGAMPYGVEPTDEPDMAGSDQDIPNFRHGGRRRRG